MSKLNPTQRWLFALIQSVSLFANFHLNGCLIDSAPTLPPHSENPGAAPKRKILIKQNEQTGPYSKLQKYQKRVRKDVQRNGYD